LQITQLPDYEIIQFSSVVGFSAMDERALLKDAVAEARLGLSEGGIPIGSVLADSTGKIISRGHNLRIQTGDPTAHAEVVCIRNAGRRTDWHKLVLVSTLSPCIMCTGTALLYKIRKVIIGENQTFKGAEDLFAANHVNCAVLQDPECIQMMRAFIQAHPDVWNEDIGIPQD
jgi:cytosine deaminase